MRQLALLLIFRAFLFEYESVTTDETVDCGTDYHINNGKASFAGIETTINQTAPVICDPGYETHSVKEITCLSNGSWSRGVACLKKDCGVDYHIDNGNVNFTSRETTFNKTVPVICNIGYDLYGSAVITCLSNGTWSHDAFCLKKDCGSVFAVKHGHIEFDQGETTFGNRFPVKCDIGYELVGDPEIVCLHHGSWSNGTSCQIKDCGSVYAVKHGHIEFDQGETTFGNRFPVKCDIGYELVGDSEIVCLHHGSWSNGISCQIKDCGTYYPMANGIVSFRGRKTTFNQTAPVYCQLGYEIYGSPEITCLPSGTWSRGTGCRKKDCGTYYPMANGRVSFRGRKTTFKQTAPVYCQLGYEIYGSPVIICLPSGTWSRGTGCRKKDCGSGYAIAHGHIEFGQKQTTFGNSFHVKCDVGYEIIGDPEIVCMQHGSWSNRTSCQIKDCGTYYPMANGRVSFRGRKTTFNQTAPVYCQLGYEIYGSPEITCLSNGTWSRGTGCRKKDCGTYYPMTNGKVSFTGRETTFNQIVPVVCDLGYEVHGKMEITCLPNGTWSRDTACLEKDCGNVYTVPNGRVEFGQGDTTFGNTFPVRCDVGYEIKGDPKITCMHHGGWSNGTSCQIIDIVIPDTTVVFHQNWKIYEVARAMTKDCGTDYTMAHGQINFIEGKTTYNQTAPVICNIGYEVHGNAEIRCLSNRSWSRNSACRKKDCGKEYTLEHGHVEFYQKDTTYGSSLSVICDIGYEIKGGPEIICMHQGSWSNSTYCEIKDCGTDYLMNNGQFNFTGRKTTFNQTVPVECDLGYEVHGNWEITCLSNGTWSRDTACHIKDCGSEYFLKNGHIRFDQGNTTFGNRVRIRCDTGYEVTGDFEITCMHHGGWSNTTSCQLKDCGANHTISNGHLLFSGRNTTYNQTIDAECSEGYELQGDPYITCLSDGTWSNNTNCTEAASHGVMIAIVTVSLFASLTIGAMVFVLYLKRTRKGCFAGRTKGPSFEQFDLEFKSWNEFRPGAVNLVDFPAYVDKLHENSNLLFADGFRLISERSPSHSKDMAESEACRAKNRYTDILPFDHSRVKLLPVDDEAGSDYINASYIPGFTYRREYIVAQGPLPATKDDFWQMIWEQKVDIVVMLTKCMEKGRKKCEQYWPERVQEPIYFGEIIVNMRSESVLADHVHRLIELTYGNKTQIVRQFHYLKWPDHGCPKGTWGLLNFITMVRQFRRLNSVGPMLVHCSAGVGRTGTYIAIDRILQHIKDHDEIDIHSVILDMRNYRSHMVQTEDQFIHIYESIRHFITKEGDEEEALSASPYPASAYDNTAFHGE